MTWLDTKDVITTLAAFVGVVLGIYNFLAARAANRVKLLVTPKASSYKGTDQSGRDCYMFNRDRYDLNHPTSVPNTLSLEVINLSKFAVTVDDVGLMRRWSHNRMALIYPIIVDGGKWPRKLESREAVTILFDVTRLLDLNNIGSVTRAYAKTICGTTCHGKSGALREFVSIASKREQ